MSDSFQIVGTTLEGKYRIDEVVGEGGFGVVYRGYHLSFKQPIAVKCLKVPAHFTPDARELFLTKFREEGMHLARLGEHSSITRVYDFGIVEGAMPIPYLVLEWLDGDDLERLLAKRRATGVPFSEVEALELLRPAIDALALAHGLGVAHRDIKPANLVLAKGARGHVLKVLDFGIAKAMAAGDTATQVATKTSSGFSAFSPSYGAPEQFRSKKYGATGPWTDVHAIGLILSEMVAGRAPFEGDETYEFYEQCSKETRPTPRALGAQVSDELEALCTKALALSPKERYRDAGELLEAVDQLLEAADHEAVDATEGEMKDSDHNEGEPPAGDDERAVAGDAPPAPRKKKKKRRTTAAAGPAPTRARPARTVAAEPLDVRPSSTRSPAPSRTPLLLGAAAVIGVGLVAYVATRGPSETQPAAPEPSASTSPSGAASGPAGKSRRQLNKPDEPLDPALAAPADVAAPPADATKTASGIAYKVQTKGSGTEHPTAADTVKVHYTGWMADGKMFDSSKKRKPGNPATFPLGNVIPGWTEGVQLMVVGETTRFWIPANLAYGDTPSRPGAPVGQLTFDIELLEIKKAQPPPPVPTDVAQPPKDATKTKSGLHYKSLKKGTGSVHPTADNKVEVHYSGWTTDGKMFDSSVTRGEPAKFGLKGVIKGWTEGVQLMVEGETMRFWIPADLAYGDKPGGGKPGGMLVFDIELLKIL